MPLYGDSSSFGDCNKILYFKVFKFATLAVFLISYLQCSESKYLMSDELIVEC